MASKEVTVREWECDACGTKVRADSNGRDLLPGWTEDTITIGSGITERIDGIEICAQCSKNPEGAKRKARARWAQ